MKYPDWKNEENYDFVEELSYLDWVWEFLRGGTKYRSEFEKFSGEVTTVKKLMERADAGRRNHNVSQAVELPPLICESMDLRAFHYPKKQPNFISVSKVSAPVEDLTDVIRTSYNIEGRILFIPHADPGFDWIFGHRIAGLVTKFGGANSHMAIRAAEFGLPAAIGLGELDYNRFRQADIIELDCAGRRIRIVQ